MLSIMVNCIKDTAVRSRLIKRDTHNGPVQVDHHTSTGYKFVSFGKSLEVLTKTIYNHNRSPGTVKGRKEKNMTGPSSQNK